MSARSDRTHRVVDGALRSAIFDHGPITVDTIDSATKRVVGQIRSAAGAVLQAEGDGSVIAGVEHLRKQLQRLQHGHSRLISQHARATAERDALRDALKAGWTWGQYEWAVAHADELVAAPTDQREAI